MLHDFIVIIRNNSVYVYDNIVRLTASSQMSYRTQWLAQSLVLGV